MFNLCCSLLSSVTLFFGLWDPRLPLRPACKAPGHNPAPVDINSATTGELKAFPGIGEAYSKRIVDGRPTRQESARLQGHPPQATITTSRTKSSPSSQRNRVRATIGKKDSALLAGGGLASERPRPAPPSVDAFPCYSPLQK